MKHLAELSDAPWLMERGALDALLARAQNESIEALVAARGRYDMDAAPISAVLRDGVATIDIRGVLVARSSWWADGQVVTGDVAQALEKAVNDTSVRSIVLRVDSPGGQASGIQDLADAVAAAAQKKPVYAVVEGMAASAAYWVVSQATSIAASTGSRVGSIGVYLVAVDASRLAENVGVKVHVVRSGPEKGVGVMGAPLTEAQLAVLQASVDELAGDFAAAVAKGRRMKADQIKELATGRVWRAADAVAAGLIDRVEPAAAAMNRITTHTKERHMADEKELGDARLAAREEERGRVRAINAAFPEDSAFCAEQIDKGATVEEASVAFIPRMREKMKADAAAAEKTRATAPIVAPKVGTLPVPHGEASTAPSGDFMAQARAMAKANGTKLTAAMSQLAKDDPALHRAFVDGQKPIKLADAMPEMQAEVGRVKR